MQTSSNIEADPFQSIFFNNHSLTTSAEQPEADHSLGH